MRIALLAKRRWGFGAALADIARRRGHDVEFVDLADLVVDDALARFDLVVLKSKQLYFLYAGFHAKALGVPVVPDPLVSRQVSTRIERPLLAARAKIETPDFWFGSPAAVRGKLAAHAYPLVRKPVVGSGSAGVELISAPTQLPQSGDAPIYLETFVAGTHLLAYFVDDEARVYEKQPFVSGRHPVRRIDVADDVRGAILRWRKVTGLRFGHLDFVRDARTGATVLVDAGVFPQFWHWPEAVQGVGDIVLGELSRATGEAAAG